MDLYARVNILGGKSVRLPKGDVHEAIPLDNDPVARVKSWFEQGVDYVHVVDLASGNDRTAYVSVSNTVIGIMLLVVGSLGALTPIIGNAGMIGLLAAMGVAGAMLTATLKDV